jgi:thioredoxin reductase (NADPH)
VEIEDVIIIGAGPGGLATSLQLKRYGIDPLVFEHNQVGGLLHNANLVENYPGFPGGIPGPDLVHLFHEQIQEYAIRIIATGVRQLSHQGDLFKISTPQQDYRSRIVVIASGTKPRQFSDITVELQDQVFYEVYPLLNHKDQRIAIVGAGDAAFDYALNLGQKNDIMVLNRSDQISCLPLLWKRVKKNPRIEYLQNIQIFMFSRSPHGKVLLECSSPDGPITLEIDYLIGAIGRDPQLDFISGQFAKKAIQLEGLGKLFYVGDVVHGLYRQTAIAVGDGILTAMKIYERLKEKVT